MKADELIKRYIEEDPRMPGPGTARIMGTGLEVGMVISYLRGVGWDEAEVASGYDIPIEAVAAAHAYYHCHQLLIDAWILTNVAGASATIHP